MNVNVKAFIKKYTMVIALVAVFILFGLLTQGRLLYPQNMSNLMLQNSYVLVLACGMLLCILTGGNIDLSVGSTVCLVGALAAQLMDKSGMNAILVIFICLMVGAVIGGWQGFWIGYVHIPPFICTLSGMFLFRGLGRVILKSKTVPVKDSLFLNIFASYVQIPGLDNAKEKWLPSALIVGVIIAAALLISVFVRRAKKSRKGYAVGPLAPELGKMVVIAALIVYYSWKLAKYKGIPVMLIWVLAVVFIGHQALRYRHPQGLLPGLSVHVLPGRSLRPADGRPYRLRQRRHRQCLRDGRHRLLLHRRRLRLRRLRYGGGHLHRRYLPGRHQPGHVHHRSGQQLAVYRQGRGASGRRYLRRRLQP